MSENILRNPAFTGGTYEIKGQTGLVLPLEWEFGWLDNGTLWRASKPGGLVELGRYNKYGPRGATGVNLKPEILAITAVPPYLDPARTEPPDNAVTGFKSWGIVCWWMSQTIPTTPGQTVQFAVRSHAWSRMETDPQDAHYSNGVGTGSFYSLEGEMGLNDGQRNYRFRVGIDPFGGVNPFGSAVVWGMGVHVYNVFDEILLVSTMTRADTATVFVMVDSLYGMINSNAYLSRPVAELIDAEPPHECRGKPRTQYARRYHVLPITTTPDRLEEIRMQVKFTDTIGGSYDDAGIGDLDNRTASLWDIPKERQHEFLDWYAEWYPGVQVEFLGEVASTSSSSSTSTSSSTTPPPPAHRRPTSTGGVHIASGPRTGYGDFLRNCNRSISIQSVEDFGALLEAKEIQPTTVTVCRVWPIGYEGDDTPPGNWLWPVSQTRAIAQDWMARIYPKLDRNTFRPDYIGFVNEPDPASVDAMYRADDFMLYCMEDAGKHGVKLAIWAWTAGLPRTPRLNPSDFEQAEMSLDSVRYASEYGHCLSMHDGSVNGSRPLLYQAYEDQTALRYRVYKTLMDEQGWSMPPVVLTEAYQEGGYKNPNWEDWAWYLNELAKDPYVLGSCWFTLGDFQGQNIQNQLSGFANLLASLPQV